MGGLDHADFFFFALLPLRPCSTAQEKEKKKEEVGCCRTLALARARDEDASSGWNQLSFSPTLLSPPVQQIRTSHGARSATGRYVREMCGGGADLSSVSFRSVDLQPHPSTDLPTLPSLAQQQQPFHSFFRNPRQLPFDMSLWVDKYRPRKLDELDYHPQLSSRLSALVRCSSAFLAFLPYLILTFNTLRFLAGGLGSLPRLTFRTCSSMGRLERARRRGSCAR